jgi:hypothetical protein
MESSCSICFESVKKNSLITPCCHFFHKGCLTRWLKTSKTCPNCRTELRFQGRGKTFEFLDTNENQNLSNISNTNITTTLSGPERRFFEGIMNVLNINSPNNLRNSNQRESESIVEGSRTYPVNIPESPIDENAQALSPSYAPASPSNFQDECEPLSPSYAPASPDYNRLDGISQSHLQEDFQIQYPRYAPSPPSNFREEEREEADSVTADISFYRYDSDEELTEDCLSGTTPELVERISNTILKTNRQIEKRLKDNLKYTNKYTNRGENYIRPIKRLRVILKKLNRIRELV